MAWQLAEAKNKLSEVVSRARDEGPQFVTRRDEEYVVLTKAEYVRLIGERPSFIEHLLNIPKDPDQELDLSRDRSPMRDVEW